VGTDDGGVRRRCDLEDPLVDAAPCVVDHVGALTETGSRDVRTPGVDTDHEVGVTVAHRRDERRDPSDLLGGVDQCPRTGLHPTDVDDVGATLDRRVHGGERRVIPERRSLVVEGVRCPVHDGHEQKGRVVERTTAQAESHA
jgi:hypothetical protein